QSHAAGVPVAVSSVKEQAIFRQVELTGSVTSPSVARLSPAISGLVYKLHVDVGDRVKAGDLLLELDSELAKLKWRSTKAQQQQASVALEDSRRRLSEAEKLAPQRSIAKTAVHDLEAEVAGDFASFEQARADADYQQAVLARHQITSPFAGVISAKLADLGEWVAQGQGVVELVATENLRMEFAVAEDYLAALMPDTSVQLVLSAYPEQPFKGEVQAIVPVADPSVRTFLLRVGVVGSSPPLIPGMSAHATLQLPISGLGEEQSTGLVVSRDATLRHADGRTVVWTIEQKDTGWIARENAVETGQAFDGLVEIRKGLTAGARVVVQGNEALQEGQLVRIVSER
ncbi:MAG: efflux RND transporter periplasmic adaptor subunit, partial [Spongiibacteraceae bacterium]